MANRVRISLVSQPAVGSILAFNISNGTYGYTVGIEFIATSTTDSNKCQLGSGSSETTDNLFSVLQTYHNPSNVIYTNENPNLWIDFVFVDDYILTFLNNAGGAALMQEVPVGYDANNAIHEIIFTPKKYTYPAIMNRNYLVTEDDFFIITEDNKKIRL